MCDFGLLWPRLLALVLSDVVVGPPPVSNVRPLDLLNNKVVRVGTFMVWFVLYTVAEWEVSITWCHTLLLCHDEGFEGLFIIKHCVYTLLRNPSRVEYLLWLYLLQLPLWSAQRVIALLDGWEVLVCTVKLYTLPDFTDELRGIVYTLHLWREIDDRREISILIEMRCSIFAALSWAPWTDCFRVSDHELYILILLLRPPI